MTARQKNVDSRSATPPLERSLLKVWRWMIVYSMISVVVTVIGCKVGPDYSRPQLPVPPMWQSTHGQVGMGTVEGDASELPWWQSLHSPELDRIVYTLEDQNYSLQEAAARINEARAQRRATATQGLPSFSSDAAYSYRRFSQNGNAFVPQANSTSGFNFLDTGIDLSWELDVWGRVKRLEEAAQADIDRSSELYRDLRVMLIAEACRTFVEARVLQHRLLVAEANLDIQRQTLALTQTRFNAELASELDVLQARTQLDLTESTVPDLEAQLHAAVFRLCILQGMPPVRDPWVIIGEGDIPMLPCDVAIGIPCDLLRQRPDVRAAEEKLKADSARVGVAIADLYPQLSINGNVSVNSRVGSTLFTQGSLAHDIGPSVKWNLFQFGRTRAAIAAAESRYEQSIAAYQQAVLESYEEVENALVRLDSAQRSEARLQSAVFHARRSYEVSVAEYGRGVLAFQTVLDTQRQLLSAQDEWAQARGTSVQALVDLYRAMGGGWLPGAWFCNYAEPAVEPAVEPVLEPLQTTPLIEPSNDWPNETIIEPLPIQEIPQTQFEPLPQSAPTETWNGDDSTSPTIIPMPVIEPLTPIRSTEPVSPDLFSNSDPIIIRLPLVSRSEHDSLDAYQANLNSLQNVFAASPPPASISEESETTAVETPSEVSAIDSGLDLGAGTIQFVPVPFWAQPSTAPINENAEPTTTNEPFNVSASPALPIEETVLDVVIDNGTDNETDSVNHSVSSDAAVSQPNNEVDLAAGQRTEIVDETIAVESNDIQPEVNSERSIERAQQDLSFDSSPIIEAVEPYAAINGSRMADSAIDSQPSLINTVPENNAGPLNNTVTEETSTSAPSANDALASSDEKTVESNVESSDTPFDEEEFNPNVARIAPLPLDTNFAPHSRWTTPIGSGLARDARPTVEDEEPQRSESDSLAPSSPSENPDQAEGSRVATLPEIQTVPAVPAQRTGSIPSDATIRLAPAPMPVIPMNVTPLNVTPPFPDSAVPDSAVPSEEAVRSRISSGTDSPESPLPPAELRSPSAGENAIELVPQALAEDLQSTQSPTEAQGESREGSIRMLEPFESNVTSPADAATSKPTENPDALIRPALEPPPRAFAPRRETVNSPQAEAPAQSPRLLDRREGAWRPLIAEPRDPVVVELSDRDLRESSPAQVERLPAETLARLPWRSAEATIHQALPPVPRR